MIEEFGFSHFKAITINDTYTTFEKDIGDKGNPAEAFPGSRLKVIRTVDFMNRVAEKFKGRSIDLIPQNCRYLEPITNGKILVIEEPPQIRTITIAADVTYNYENLKARGLLEEYGYVDYFEKNAKKDGSYRFTLAFPYLIFVIRLTERNEYASGKVFFRKKPLLGLGEILFKAPLYNVNGDQNLCIGHDSNMESSSPSVNVAIQRILNRFWAAAFNPDYNANVGVYQAVPIVSNWFEWEYHTRTNPLFIYNVDFLPNNNNKKLMDEIKYYRGETGDNPNGRSLFSFQSLSQSFDTPTASGVTVKDPVYGDETNLLENIAHGIMGRSGQTADIGDRLKLRNTDYVIETFLGPESGVDPSHVRMINTLTNERKLFKLSSQFKTKLYDAIFEYRLIENIVFSGVTIAKNDIVLMKKRDGREFYKRIDYIRRNIDGNPEIKVSDEYLTPMMFEKSFVKKVEIDKISVRGDYIKSGDEFYIIRTVNPELPITTYDELFFDGPSVNGGAIGLQFNLGKLSSSLTGNLTQFMHLNAITQHENTLDKPSSSATLIKKSEVIELPPIFRYFRNLYRTKYSLTGTSKIRAVKNKYFMLTHNDGLQNGLAGDTDKATKVLLVGDSLVVNSYDVDMSYTVGEKIIIADWENPEKLLVPKTITGFKTDLQEKTNSINISLVLSDKLGNLEVSPFITYDGKIAAGRVRKIAPEMNGVKAGTKIVAKEASIYCFPKKDVNIIVGFLTDTAANEPLVLCSNGLTLWFSDLEKFDMIPFTSRKWKTLDHAPIVDQYSIKLQPGDVVKGNAGYGIDDFLIYKHTEAKTTLRAMLFSYFHSYAESVAVSNNFRYSVSFDCIPNPRVSSSDIETIGYVTGYPNLFGGINPNPMSSQQFIADPRSIVK